MHPKSNTITGILAALTLLFAASISAQEVEWVTDYHEGLERAKSSGKPIFLTYRCVP